MSQQKILEARRRAEEQGREMEAVLVEHDKILLKANFEKQTTAKIEARIKNNRFEQLRREKEQDLFERRRELAALYNDEIADWRVKIANLGETREDVQARIMKKAYALRDARESAREKFIKGCYDAQWRDACDDARSLDSKAMTKFMGAERVNQIRQKQQRNIELTANENDFLAEWKRQLDIIEARDKAKSDLRKKNNLDTAKGLRDQINFNDSQRDTYWRMQQEADEQEIRECNEAIAAEDAKQKARHDEAHRRGKETAEYNKTFKDIEAERKRKEREENEILLNYALEQERQRIAEEEGQKAAWAAAAQQQRKFLEELMIKEAEDTSFVDEVNRKEAEKVWKARDDALQAREDARNFLMKLVRQGREEQIAEKRAREAREKQADKIYASKFIDDIKEGLEMDRAAVERRRLNAAANNEKLMQQIDLRRMQQELAKQDTYLEDKRMKFIERQHQDRLALQGGSVRLRFPLMKNEISSGGH